jgi:hypothetical protein
MQHFPKLFEFFYQIIKAEGYHETPGICCQLSRSASVLKISVFVAG